MKEHTQLDRYKATTKWFEDVYSIKVEIKKSKTKSSNPYWANIKYHNDIESSDYFPTYQEALINGIHIAFTLIK